MNVTIPELSLVVLIGVSGSGKSTFAEKHFKSTEILSSDVCRGLVSDDENNQSATNDAFDVLNFIVGKRLANRRLTVIDATNVQPEARKQLVKMARHYHVLPVAIVLDLPEKTCRSRNRDRADRNFGAHVIRQQKSQLRRSLRQLKREGFRNITVLDSETAIESIKIERQKLWNDLKHEQGPFDVIGDLHGCATELERLLERLGYQFDLAPNSSGTYHRAYYHPEDRKAIFVGDLVDRGPRSLDCVQLVQKMVQNQTALCVPGNHDVKLVKKLRGRNVQVRHGLERTLAEIEALPENLRQPLSENLAEFLDGLISHYVLDEGKLVVAHAGLNESMQGRASGKVREFALYGETTGETDEFGLPIRYNWASEYRGDATVVYGHTPVPEAEWLNRTINVDTGAVFGGKLTALRYPEMELVSVKASEVYSTPIRPLADNEGSNRSSQQLNDDVLDIQDVSGKRIVNTRLRENISIRAENNAAALEVMSRFAVDPRWLIYLPPTMSPSETVPTQSEFSDWLEYPQMAFDYYRNHGVRKIICEEKHMGSRAIVVICRNPKVAEARFGVEDGSIGTCYTRTGRAFFKDHELEAAVFQQLNRALGEAQFWKNLETEWVCLDCEIMPWSVKAQELIRHQYAAVGAASLSSLPPALDSLEKAKKNGLDVDSLLTSYRQKQQMTERYRLSYQPYCWPVTGVADIKLAPFHIMATEGSTHVDKANLWHMNAIRQFTECDPTDCLQSTEFREVDLADSENAAAAERWWLDLTSAGGEGMVVKSNEFIPRGKRGLLQPAVKCRGREYLRIIYGPEYTAAENLSRLRNRRLTTKRSLAIREFALGIEALERFVKGQPLRRVHECVFSVLALESEAIDPRL